MVRNTNATGMVLAYKETLVQENQESSWSKGQLKSDTLQLLSTADCFTPTFLCVPFSAFLKETFCSCCRIFSPQDKKKKGSGGGGGGGMKRMTGKTVCKTERQMKIKHTKHNIYLHGTIC